jgi:L-asparaginase II
MSFPHLTVSVTRGGIVESNHQISATIVNSQGETLHQWGDAQKPVYPRSSIKALQALAFMERRGDEHFKLTTEEISVLCASHNGEEKHVQTVSNILAKIGFQKPDFECGAHWPMRAETSYQLASTGEAPNNAHNNCSGKHAGMLGLAKLLNVDHHGYINIDHAVQTLIADTMADMCEYDYKTASWSPDGCSAPTWAIPLHNLALAFAKFADPVNESSERQRACKTLFDSVVKAPFMVAGTDRYCTQMMTVLGDKVFLKVGAEGVYIAAIPEQKIAIALKCEDGATRGAESVMTALLDLVGATKHVDEKEMVKFRRVQLKNWNQLRTGEILCEAVT